MGEARGFTWLGLKDTPSLAVEDCKETRPQSFNTLHDRKAVIHECINLFANEIAQTKVKQV